MSHCNHSKKKLCKEKKIGSDSSWRESCCLFYGWGKERRIGCARPKKTKERYENIPPNILRWDHATSKAPSGLLALLRIARPPRTRASFADVPLLPSAPPCRHLLHSSPTLFDTCRVTIGTRGGPGNSCQRGGGVQYTDLRPHMLRQSQVTAWQLILDSNGKVRGTACLIPSDQTWEPRKLGKYEHDVQRGNRS